MHRTVVMFFPLPWVSFWRSDTMSRRGSLILQEHWSDPLCCVLLFFSVATPESVAWRMWVSSCALTAKKEFAAEADQTSPTRLGTRQADYRGTQSLRIVKWRDGWKMGGSCEIFWVCWCVFFFFLFWHFLMICEANSFCLPVKHFVRKHIAATLENKIKQNTVITI